MKEEVGQWLLMDTSHRTQVKQSGTSKRKVNLSSYRPEPGLTFGNPVADAVSEVCRKVEATSGTKDATEKKFH